MLRLLRWCFFFSLFCWSDSLDLGRLLVSVFIVEAQQFIVDDDDITRSLELVEVKVSYLIQFVNEYENPWSQVLN